VNQLLATPRAGKSSDRAVLWAQAAICVAAFAGALWVAGVAGITALRPDTASYLYFDPSRSVGYPAFLWLVRSITGQAYLAVPLQMLLLAGSLLVLGWNFHKLARQPALSILFQLLLVCSPEMWKASASLVTEALATSCVAIWCAILLRLQQVASLRRVAQLSVVAGLAVLVRPSLLPLFLATGVIGLLCLPRPKRWTGLGVVIVSLVAAWGATPAVNYLLHGSAATGSPVARGVLQHTLFCAPAADFTDEDAAFVEQSAAPVRRYISGAPPDVQPVLRQLYSGELRFGLIIPETGRRHGMQAGWQTDPILGRIAQQRIAANPACYAKSALTTYYRLATYDTAGAPAQVARIKSFLAAHPPVEVAAAPLLPVEEKLALQAAAELRARSPARPGQRAYEPPKVKPLVLMIGARILFTVAAAVGILAVGLMFGSKDSEHRRVVSTLAVLGLAFHGVVALTALVEFPLMRYTVPIWPVVCTLLGLSATMVVGRVIGAASFRREAPNSPTYSMQQDGL